LAAVVALKAPTLNPPISLVFQLLIVPVIDNTASPSEEPYASWRENALTAWLPSARMLWFRNNYLPIAEDRVKWDSSPIFAPDSMFSKAPKAWIGVTEMDILRDEGIAYGEKLKQAGVQIEVKVYEKAPHPIMALDGTLVDEIGPGVNH
jgi:acetyl esterase/lipase